MAEKLVLIGMIPEVVAIGPHDQWPNGFAGSGNLKVEFDPAPLPVFVKRISGFPPGHAC